MRFLSIALLCATALADKPAPAPAYVAPVSNAAPAADSYGSPAAAPAGDSYGSPAAAPVAEAQDSYGSPAAPVVQQQDEYGSPAAPVQQSYNAAPAPAAAAAPVGNQGYYYYYYPVKQNSYAAAEPADDGGLLGGLSGLLGPLLGKKILLLALGITGFLVLAALGVNLTVGGGRAFSSMASVARSYANQDTLFQVLDAIQYYESL